MIDRLPYVNVLGFLRKAVTDATRLLADCGLEAFLHAYSDDRLLLEDARATDGLSDTMPLFCLHVVSTGERERIVFDLDHARAYAECTTGRWSTLMEQAMQAMTDRLNRAIWAAVYHIDDSALSRMAARYRIYLPPVRAMGGH